MKEALGKQMLDTEAVAVIGSGWVTVCTTGTLALEQFPLNSET